MAKRFLSFFMTDSAARDAIAVGSPRLPMFMPLMSSVLPEQEGRSRSDESVPPMISVSATAGSVPLAWICTDDAKTERSMNDAGIVQSRCLNMLLSKRRRTTAKRMTMSSHMNVPAAVSTAMIIMHA